MTRTTDSSVSQVQQLLLSDPDFVIAAAVNNNFAAIRERFATVMRSAGPSTVQGMTSVLQAMRSRGEKGRVANILSVPWVDRGASPLDTAVRTLRAEGAARLNDPGSPIRLKSAVPSSSLGPDDTPENMPTTAATNATADVEDTNTFWNSLPGILTAAGGLVGAFTGNLPAAANGGGAPPATSDGSGVLKTVLIILGVAAGITAVALIIRALRKK